MTVDQYASEISALPVDEQLAIVQAIWDRLPNHTTSEENAAVKAELDRRLQSYVDDPSFAMTLEQFKAKRAER